MKHFPIVQFQRATAPGERTLDPVLVERARNELAFTALRRRKLPSRRVGDLDWLMLLELFVAHAEGRELKIKDLGEIAPLTTRLRYLDHLEREGMIARTISESDARATLVRATASGVARIATILSDVAIVERPESGARAVKGAR